MGILKLIASVVMVFTISVIMGMYMGNRWTWYHEIALAILFTGWIAYPEW